MCTFIHALGRKRGISWHNFCPHRIILYRVPPRVYYKRVDGILGVTRLSGGSGGVYFCEEIEFYVQKMIIL